MKSPPFSKAARLEAELRINDESATWRIVYRVDSDAVVILEVFSKKTQATPAAIIRTCKARLRAYDNAIQGQ